MDHLFSVWLVSAISNLLTENNFRNPPLMATKVRLAVPRISIKLLVSIPLQYLCNFNILVVAVNCPFNRLCRHCINDLLDQLRPLHRPVTVNVHRLKVLDKIMHVLELFIEGVA